MPMMPKPTAPFIPSQPSQGPSLKDQLATNKSTTDQPAMAPQGLPPLPSDISKDVGSVAKRVSAMSDKVSKLESELPPLPESTETDTPKPTASQPGAKVFVRLDKYSDILKTINHMESKINELQNALGKISSIKDSEQEIISSWTSLINEARDRVTEVNSKLPPLNR